MLLLKRIGIAALAATALMITAWLVVRSLGEPVVFSAAGRPPSRGASPRSTRTLKILSYNIAHGRGPGRNQIFTANDRIRRNLDALGDYLRWEGADLVGLQEVDQDCLWSGGVNQARVLARLGGYRHYRVGLNNDVGWPLTTRYGNAILSRHPILSFRNHRFGDATLGEKGFLEARIEVEGRAVTVAVVHLHHALPRARERQALRMATRLKSLGGPVILMGDFNVAPTWNERTLDTIQSVGKLVPWRLMHPGSFTFHASRPTRRIDFVFVSPDLKFGRYAVRQVELSDHLPVLAEVERAKVTR